MATGVSSAKSTTKTAWLEEGKALGERVSASGWEIGKWLVQGEEQFLGTVPTSKKAKHIYFANRRANWLSLYREAAEVTNLKDTTLRQYARVVRHGVRVDGLPFAHHIEVQRARTIDEKGKRHFHESAARDILNLAKEKGWTVAETRAEVVRRFPSPKVVETVLEKARRVLLDILRTVDGDDQLTFLEALAIELPLIREQVERERAVVIQRILNDGEGDDFDDSYLNPDFAF
jgi:hypothetical protein